MTHDALELNKALALGLLGAIADGDTDRIEQLLAPECSWWVQGWGSQPRDRFVASLTATIRRADTRSMRILWVTAEADRVAVAAEGAFAFPEGVYANSYHYLFTMQDGRIVDGREYLDTRVAAAFYSARS